MSDSQENSENKVEESGSDVVATEMISFAASKGNGWVGLTRILVGCNLDNRKDEVGLISASTDSLERFSEGSLKTFFFGGLIFDSFLTTEASSAVGGLTQRY